MKFEDLSPEDQKLLRTDFGELDKVASGLVKQAGDCYARGFEKTAVEIADGLDKSKKEEEEEKKKKMMMEKEHKLEDEHEKSAAELGAIYERGVFDGLAKLGSDRHGDPLHYFWPFIEEKVAASGAAMALNKLASVLKVAEGKKDNEGHHVRRALLGNANSAAIEAKKGHKAEAWEKAVGHSALESVRGAGMGAAGGTALGAGAGLAHALAKGGHKGHSLGKGALMGAMGGLYAGSIGGAIKGNHDRRASEIHGEHSKNK